MMSFKVALLMSLLLGQALAFWGSDENKYIKKFAMMKVYESCFGDEVVREVREEMRAAAARCAAAGAAGPPGPSNTQAVFEQLENTVPQTTRPPATTPTPTSTTTTAAPDTTTPQYFSSTRRPYNPAVVANMGTETLLRLQTLLQGLKNFMNPSVFSQHGGANLAAAAANVANAFTPQAIPQPQQPAQDAQAIPAQHFPQRYPFTPQNYAPQGYSPYGGGYAPPAPYYPYPPAVHNPYYSYQQNPFAAFFNPRTSRDMDFRSSNANAKSRNITCVMQELGYLDANLQPNYSGIISRIQRLPLPAELKSDMSDAVQFCQKFAQCVPEPDENKMQVSAEFTKPMLFFKCYKQKKLEACVLKDVRERFMLATGGNNADPEIPDHNTLDEEESTGIRNTFRGRSSRIMRKRNKMSKVSSATTMADLSDVVFGDATLAL
ncbi:Hypothetical predicted protein [Cloeon dipterum]|uniref:Uncharacterized protein n=2 Tax=Cloeon dipterum TaxID=197152 RepID=A0A8S1CW95_9INSE|nr:Hypothetical predicted protein [Cloeon dipterum]